MATSSALTAEEHTEIYTLKIILGKQNPTWRRVLVPANFSLLQLHVVIQDVFGFEDYHLHKFFRNRRGGLQLPLEYYMVGGEVVYRNYKELKENSGIYLSDMGDLVLDERVYKLYHVLRQEKQNIMYEYDFGFSWQLKIKLEKIVERKEDMKYPVCVKGRGPNLPEDGNFEESSEDLKFDLNIVRDMLNNTYADKWPVLVDNMVLDKCYMCGWRGFQACGGKSSCTGQCCGYCLKSEFLKQKKALDISEMDKILNEREQRLMSVFY